VRASDEALELARTLRHPFSLAVSHVFAAAVAHACRQPDRMQAHAEAAAAISRDQDFRLLIAWSSVFEGSAAVSLERAKKGCVELPMVLPKRARWNPSSFCRTWPVSRRRRT